MMFDSPQHLYFFFDYISHNAWLAWHRLPALVQRHGLVLEPVPVLFAALLQAHQQRGPAEVPAKLEWMKWNVLRKAAKHGIPIAPPHSHPFNPLLPLRLSCCALPAPDRLRLMDVLFRATWVDGRAVSQPDEVRALLQAAGFDADALLAECQTDGVKARLRDNTDAAVRAGVFGVPTLMTRGELFWGFDDLPQLEDLLAGRDPLHPDRHHYDGWLNVRPSAQRRP